MYYESNKTPDLKRPFLAIYDSMNVTNTAQCIPGVRAKVEVTEQLHIPLQLKTCNEVEKTLIQNNVKWTLLRCVPK